MAGKPNIVDVTALLAKQGSTSYPAEFRAEVAGRHRQVLGDPVGLTHFGVARVRLEPGARSALRHWHECEDEFVLVLEGELVLLTDAGETVLKAGMAAGFPAGRDDGHCLINRSSRDAVYLEIGDRQPGDVARYPDHDLVATEQGGRRHFTRRDGTPY
ncbi:cupin domain-containing protein [Oceanibaculum nanhaiense]|uniref:cupin domain-containing protein n=1 Tax=Oceanibaculum nanhaiense TaxID=1909734 RepID=UPI003F70D3C2